MGRALGLSLALLAITLNFLQPLAHAAAMRDGAAGSMGRALWTAFCKAGVTPGNRQDGAPTPASGTSKPHECCLGLAHAVPLAAPPGVFVTVEPVAADTAPSLPAEHVTSAGIRDGPSRPRGPPTLA